MRASFHFNSCQNILESLCFALTSSPAPPNIAPLAHHSCPHITSPRIAPFAHRLHLYLAPICSWLCLHIVLLACYFACTSPHLHITLLVHDSACTSLCTSSCFARLSACTLLHLPACHWLENCSSCTSLAESCLFHLLLLPSAGDCQRDG